MSIEKEAVADLFGDATGLVYETVGNTLFGPPAGGIIGGVAGDVAGDVGLETLTSIDDVLSCDVSSLPEVIDVLADPLGAANQHLLEEVPVIGPVLSDGVDLLRDLPGLDLLGGCSNQTGYRAASVRARAVRSYSTRPAYLREWY